MNSYDEAFRVRLTKKIAAARQEAVDLLALGNAVDWADYRYRAGFLRALTEIHQFCEETERDLA